MKRVLSFALGAALAASFAADAGAAKYKEGSVANGGTITGKVAIGSAKVESKSFVISKDPRICGTGNRDVPFVRANGDALLDAVVYLDKVKEGKAFPAGLKKVTIDQKGCEFHPYLSVMRNQGELEAVNSDPTLHNIHTYEFMDAANKKRRTLMNVSQPEKGNMVTKKVKMRRGVGMKVECDAHDFMHAFVFVARNPYFAVVKDDGSFEIGDVPPGKYTIKVWHGFLGTAKGTVEVKAGGKASVNLGF